MLNSEMLYFRTIIIIRKLAYYKLNGYSEGYVHTTQVKQLNHMKLTLHQKYTLCGRETFSSVVIQEYIGFSKKLKIMTSFLTYITFNIRALTPKICSPEGSNQRKSDFCGFIHKYLRFLITCCHIAEACPGGSAGKESACNVGDLGSISGLGRAPGEGTGYPLQCSGLEDSVHEVTKSQTRLSDFHFHTAER